MNSPMDTGNLSRVRMDCPNELCPHGTDCFGEFHLDFSAVRKSFSEHMDWPIEMWKC